MTRAASIILLVAGMVMPAGFADAQALRAEATVVPEKTYVGNRVTLRVVVEAPAGSDIIIPTPADDVLGTTWSVNGDPQISKQETSAGQRMHAVFEIVPFEIGTIQPPVISVQVRPTTGTDYETISVPAPSVVVQSVLPADAEQIPAPLDIKDPVELPIPPALKYTAMALAALIGALTLAALFLFLARRVRNLRQPPLTIDQWALAELDKLVMQQLPHHKRFKEYYVRLSDIVRLYIREVFGVDAPELTTPELLDRLENGALPAGCIELVQEILDTADLAKFAKYSPDGATCTRSMENARTLVLKTRTRVISLHHGSGGPDVESPGEAA